MAGLGAPDTIGDWSQSQLVRWIRDLFQNTPPDFLPLLKAEEVAITEKLTLPPTVKLSREANFRQVGETGQPAFENSWANYGSGWQVAGFWKDPTGVVHLRGLVKTGTNAANIFTLPPGFRPALSETHPILIYNGTIGRLDILSDGSVYANGTSTTWTSLSGVSFRTS